MINTPRPIKGLWVRPTTVATAVPKYGPIYGIKSVIPQNKPNNKADFKPIILNQLYHKQIPYKQLTKFH